MTACSSPPHLLDRLSLFLQMRAFRTRLLATKSEGVSLSLSSAQRLAGYAGESRRQSVAAVSYRNIRESNSSEVRAIIINLFGFTSFFALGD